MENITKALILAFSMIMFVIGFSYSMYLINHLLATSEVLLDSVSTTKFYDNLHVTSDVNSESREVTVDTVVSTLYRYNKESYAVHIYVEGTLIQVFDINLESKIARAAGDTKGDPELKSLKNSKYNEPDQPTYLFEAPWIGNSDHIRSRIDYFLEGTKGYINNTLVDYTKICGEEGFLAWWKGKQNTHVIYESFVEYAYAGETISTANGVETITGDTQESNKIIITYKVEAKP